MRDVYDQFDFFFATWGVYSLVTLSPSHTCVLSKVCHSLFQNHTKMPLVYFVSFFRCSKKSSIVPVVGTMKNAFSCVRCFTVVTKILDQKKKNSFAKKVSTTVFVSYQENGTEKHKVARILNIPQRTFYIGQEG